MTSHLAAFAAATAALLASTPATAANELQVAEVEIVNLNDGTANANANAIYVRGNFSPALPCPTQGFVMFPSDPFLKEVMAMLLMAKSTGRPVSFTNVYCHSTGYGRGNG